MNRSDQRDWEFGSFRLDGAQHLLFREGQLVPLSRKAVDILAVLLESHGQLVEKEALMRRVWPDSFVEESNLAVHISQLRKTLAEESALHRIETIPRRGYRFVGQLGRAVVEPSGFVVPAEAAEATVAQIPVTRLGAASGGVESALAQRASGPLDVSTTAASRRRRVIFGGIAAACVAAIILSGLFFRTRRLQAPPVQRTAAATAVQPTDSVVVGEITNNTGDPIFDTTLRQAMAIELEQSPYLRLVQESRIRRTLALMGKPAQEPLTAEIARQVCLRTGSEAVVDGWIAKLGSEYVLGLRAVNCRSGDHLAELQATAAGKEQVLKALGDSTGQLRTQLGESLSTVQRFDTPIEEATTPSLEALQAYSLGKATMIQKGDSADCLPFFQRAVRLDPDFAMAYAGLGTAYSNLGEAGRAASNIRRAYALRQRASERERLYIESHYEAFVTGNLTKAKSIYENWAATYPADAVPETDLTVIDSDLGKYEPDLTAAKAALRLAPDDAENYANLTNAYLLLGRLSDARATLDQAQARKFDTSDIHLYLYDLAFLQHDTEAMQQQVAWAAGEPGVEDLFLGHEAATHGFEGENAKARESTDRATETARRAGQKETAAGYEVEAAQREALFGNHAEALRRANAALALAGDRDTRYGAALALALAGETRQAEAIAGQLNKEFPDDTLVQFICLPTIRGAAALAEKDAARALHDLDVTAPYELGVSGGLFPVYLRGIAYLALNDGAHAEAEFEKMAAHPGILLDSPLGPMARVQLARAYLLEKQPARARSGYQDFLASWKNADGDLPILLTVKTEASRQGEMAAR